VAFSLSGLSFPLTDIKTPHRVGVYVDGYNLYYGRLRGSAFKWLDTVKLLAISDELLAAAQLPQLITTRTKPIRKPPHW
jgi:hypothetical protein